MFNISKCLKVKHLISQTCDTVNRLIPFDHNNNHKTTPLYDVQQYHYSYSASYKGVVSLILLWTKGITRLTVFKSHLCLECNYSVGKLSRFDHFGCLLGHNFPFLNETKFSEQNFFFFFFCRSTWNQYFYLLSFLCVTKLCERFIIQKRMRAFFKAYWRRHGIRFWIGLIANLIRNVIFHCRSWLRILIMSEKFMSQQN